MSYKIVITLGRYNIDFLSPLFPHIEKNSWRYILTHIFFGYVCGIACCKENIIIIKANIFF